MSLAARRHSARPISAERGSTCASRALAALRRRRARWTLAALIAALAAASIAALCIGAYRLSPAQLLGALTATDAQLAGDAALRQARAVLVDIRAPRVVLALFVGAGFGAAGAAMQALFRNPLADPGLIGVSSGAALGASALIVLGPLFAARLALGLLPVAAFAGALAVAALVYRLAVARGRLALPLLLLGEAEAMHLGVPVPRVKRRVLVGTAMCVGALVSCTGAIGFIGLVAPHCVRLAAGADQRIVMPGAALFGALLAVAADLAARTLAAPAEIPLGILTALIGAPFFLALLWKRRGALGG